MFAPAATTAARRVVVRAGWRHASQQRVLQQRRWMCTQPPAKTVAKEGAAPPSTHTEAATATPPPVVKTVVKKKGSFGERLGAFIAGVTVAAAVGYYKLHTDIWESTMQVERSIVTMKSDVVHAHTQVQKRLSELEHEVAALKANQR